MALLSPVGPSDREAIRGAIERLESPHEPYRFQHSSESAFRRWLFTTALRKLSNRRDHHLAECRDLDRTTEGEKGDGALARAYGRIATPSRHASVREELQRVEAAMEALAEEERGLIALARIVGLSNSEIAAESGISVGAVRLRMHRASAKLSVRWAAARGATGPRPRDGALRAPRGLDRPADDDTYQLFTLPASTAGTVYVRVRDTDRTLGACGLDAVHVDEIFFRSDT